MLWYRDRLNRQLSNVHPKADVREQTRRSSHQVLICFNIDPSRPHGYQLATSDLEAAARPPPIQAGLAGHD